MKTIVFDTSSIISLAVNNLLWILKDLKKIFKGKFVIPENVKKELIDNPLNSRYYKLEAIMINGYINNGDLEVYPEINVDELLDVVNHVYYAEGKNLVVLQRAEVEALALASKIGALAYSVDERTMRLLIEDPYRLRKLLERKLDIKISINRAKLDRFHVMIPVVPVIRSTELALIAYEKGLFKNLISGTVKEHELLEGLLYGLKMRGCSISDLEIEGIEKEEL